MKTIKVRLRDDLAKAGMGFTDIEGKQELRPGKKRDLDVELTPFVQRKIHTGELVVVSSERETAPESAPPPSGSPDPDEESGEQPAQNAVKGFIGKVMGKKEEAAK